MSHQTTQIRRRQSGVTMVEILVALSIGSFLMIGAVQVYNQSRHAFTINESIARVQETAQFALDTLEADLRMASSWGMHSRGIAVEGRSLLTDSNPTGLAEPLTCGSGWALDLARPVAGTNNSYDLPCAATSGAQPSSDTITTRRATVAVSALEAGRLQIQTTRIQGEIFDDGTVPPMFDPDPTISQTHNLLVSTYYVASDSELVPGVPTLRRKTLQMAGGAPVIVDQEVAPGVENIQLMLGVDVDADNTVDRYVNPDDDIIDPSAGGFVPGSRVMTARIWLLVRGVNREPGIEDASSYAPGDVVLGTYSDDFRRMLVSKTILLRNTRS